MVTANSVGEELYTTFCSSRKIQTNLLPVSSRETRASGRPQTRGCSYCWWGKWPALTCPLLCARHPSPGFGCALVSATRQGTGSRGGGREGKLGDWDPCPLYFGRNCVPLLCPQFLSRGPSLPRLQFSLGLRKHSLFLPLQARSGNSAFPFFVGSLTLPNLPSLNCFFIKLSSIIPVRVSSASRQIPGLYKIYEFS